MKVEWKRNPDGVDLTKDPSPKCLLGRRAADEGSFARSTTAVSIGNHRDGTDARCIWHLIWFLFILSVIHPTVSPAQETEASQSEVRVQISDGGWIEGRLVSPKTDGAIAVSNTLFSQPIEFLAGQVLECLPTKSDRLIDLSQENTFAFLLNNGDRYVGQLIEWENGRVVVSTEALGQVEFDAGKLVELFDSKLLAARLFSLERSVWRWDFRQPKDGDWRIEPTPTQPSQLVCVGARRAVVGSLDLPKRFRLHLEITCDDSPDFELALGDRHEDVLENLARRGGSRPQSPGERFVSKMEWFDQTVSLVRSNGSVSDSVVFRRPESTSNTDSQSRVGNRLEIDLFFDQSQGVLAAFCEGRLMGRTGLKDDRPVFRERLTMINRGAAVRVRLLDLFEWDGDLSGSSERLFDAAELKDGTRFDGMSETRFLNGQFQFDDQSVASDRMLRLRTGNAVTEDAVGVDQGRAGEGSVEVLTRDGCRVSGLLVRARITDSTPQPASAADELRLRLGDGMELSIVTRDIRRIIGAARQLDRPTDGSLFQASSVSLPGRLVAGDGSSHEFGWRANSARDSVGIDPGNGRQAVSVPEFVRLQDEASAAEKRDLLSLRSGDQLAGRVISVGVQGVEIQSVVSGTVMVPHSSIKALTLAGRTDRVETALAEKTIEKLLVVPRRIEDNPPTHVIIAANGDAVRGRLISLEDERVNFELRSKTRTIAKDKIVRIIWLSESAAMAEPVGQWINTEQGDRLGLLRPRFDGATLVGQHRVLGECRIEKAAITRLRFGDREKRPSDAWKLVPAKQPRSFDEPLE